MNDDLYVQEEWLYDHMNLAVYYTIIYNDVMRNVEGKTNRNRKTNQNSR